MDAKDKEISQLRLEVQRLKGELRVSLQALDLAREIINFDPRGQKWQDRDQILATSAEKAKALVKFKAVSFFLVNEHDSSFELTFCLPSSAYGIMRREYERAVSEQTFAMALTKNKPHVVRSSFGKKNLLLHPLSSAARTRGMFFGLLEEDWTTALDLPFNLLSLIFLATVLLLESTEMYKRFRGLSRDLSHALLAYQKLNVRLEEKNKQLEREIQEKAWIEQALKESKEHYKAIFENSGTPMLILEEDGTVVMANREAEAVFGYKRNKVSDQKQKWTEYVLPEDLEKMTNYHKLRRKNSGLVPSRYTARIIDVQGSERYCLLNVAMLPGSKRSIVSIMDLTRQNELERQLRQAQKLDALGTLAGGIAHEFNNLLHALNVNLNLIMKQRGANDPDYSYLQKMKAIEERAGEIVRKVLAFSRETDPVLEAIDLNLLLKETLGLLSNTIPRHIELKMQLDANAQLLVWGDRIQIEQVVINLVTNAVDALKDNSKGHIWISTGMVSYPDFALWGQND